MRKEAVVLCVASALLALLSSSGEARAQQPPRRSPEWAMERETRERWMHGAQQPRFTAFAEDRSFLAIDSIRRDGDLRRLDITLRRTALGRDSAVITTDATGRVLRIDAGVAPVMRRGLSPEDSARLERFNRMALDGRLTLVGTRVWDLVVPFPQASRVGARWTDTIAHTANDSPYVQTMTGRRTNRITGDTSIGGRRLWIVRDSAVLTYAERRPEQETSLGVEAHVSRTVSGILCGVYLYDPVTQLTWRRVDTAVFTGEALLGYADGRVFRTPARYERFRAWQLHDSTQYKARREALNRESADRSGGMVIVAESGVQRRLQENDVALQDSLIGAMQRAVDGDESMQLYRTLTMWSRGANLRRRLDSTLIALGDSGHLYRTLQEVAYSRSPFSTDDARAMIPFLEDPGKAWALNANRDYLYSNLVQGMTTWPLAAPGYRGRTACSPDACRLLGTYYGTAREPRLRDVALVALFTTDPATWADTVLRLGGPAHPLLRSSVALAGGVGANWPAAARLPMPSPDSDWRAWLQWMDGRDPAFVRQQVASAAESRIRVDTAPRVRFEESHRTALLMHMALTRRDVVGELRRGYDRATNDTALQVFGTLLDGLDALELTEAQMADAFTSGQPGRTALARRVLQRAFATSATPMPDSAAAPLVDRLLAVVIDTATLWRMGASDLRAPRRASPELHARRGRVRLSAENLPPSIREKWAGRVEIFTPGQARGDDLREQAVTYTLKPVVRLGRFVRLTIDASEQLARRADQAPNLYASGTTYYLMQLGDEWVIVAMEAWVT